jgi:hypothetical protein
MLALVPSPPSKPHPRGGMVVAKGVVVDTAKTNAISREEVYERKLILEAESTERQDTEFLIAHARSEFRRLSTTKVPKPVAKQEILTLERLLFDPRSPPRKPKAVPEFRESVLKHRPLPSKLVQLLNEENELREWVQRLEERLRQEFVDTDAADRRRILRFDTLAAQETVARSEYVAEEAADFKFLVKREFVHRPPHRPPPPKPQLDFFQTEAAARTELEEEEQRERREAHDWLCLRYGVRLFSVARVEDGYRVELEEEFDASFTLAVKTFYRVEYRCPMLALCGINAKVLPIVTELALEARSAF